MRFSEYKPGNIVSNAARRDTAYVLKEIKGYQVIVETLDGKKQEQFNKSNLRPVALTLDRLKRFRFTRVHEKWVYNNCWVLPWTDRIFYVEFGNTCDRIESVHELQNLYAHQAGEQLPPPILKEAAKLNDQVSEWKD